MFRPAPRGTVWRRFVSSGLLARLKREYPFLIVCHYLRRRKLLFVNLQMFHCPLSGRRPVEPGRKNSIAFDGGQQFTPKINPLRSAKFRLAHLVMKVLLELIGHEQRDDVIKWWPVVEPNGSIFMH